MLATQSFEQGLVFNATNGNLDAFNQLVLTHQHILRLVSSHESASDTAASPCNRRWRGDRAASLVGRSQFYTARGSYLFNYSKQLTSNPKM